MRSIAGVTRRMPVVVLATASLALAVVWPDWRDALLAGGYYYYYGVCGDGRLDPGEQCDDGNLEGGDCCGPTCLAEPDGCPCDDALRCTVDDFCLLGACVGLPIDTCSEQSGCAPIPLDGCHQTTKFADVTLLLRDHPEDRRDELAWRWRRGGTSPLEAFGDPTTVDGYAFCVYEPLQEPPNTLIMQAEVPPGALCDGEPCWRSVQTGFVYRDRQGAVDGITRIELETGVAGRSSVVVRGMGAALPMPTLPVDPPLTVQLQATNGECWEARYFEGGAGTNDAGRFRGKAGAAPIATTGEDGTGHDRVEGVLECRPDLIPTPLPSAKPTPGPPNGFDLDLGWTGIAHDLTGPAPIDLGPSLTCDGGPDCLVGLPPSGGLLPPFPISAGGVPVCVVPEIDVSLGTYDPTSECGAGLVQLIANVHLVQDIAIPCPICVGDPVVGDGIRDGVCHGNAATPGAACDAEAETVSFGGTSRDCLPDGLSVGEPVVVAPWSTVDAVLAPTVDCLSPFFPPGSCYCEEQILPNACTDGVCSATGECLVGPFDGSCSAEPFRACLSTADCEGLFPGAGTCVFGARPCFGDAISRVGTCGSPGRAVSAFCVPPTRAAAVNVTYGLPGPAALTMPIVVDLP